MKSLLYLLKFLFFIILLAKQVPAEDSPEDELIVLTVATKETESLQRYLRSAKVNELNVKVLGQGQVWTGGNVKDGPGGGMKINLMKKELEQYKDQEKIILFTDSYDVLLLGSAKSILSQFKMSSSGVLFGAESFCWPDESLTNSYPEVIRGKRFLNSGGYIGYSNKLYTLLTQHEIEDSGDDQLYFTKLFLNEDLRAELKIKLDTKSTIFHNLNGASSEVELRFKEKKATLVNTLYNTSPLVLHGNGPTKTVLSSFGNYLADNWDEEKGCSGCWDNMKSLQDVSDDDLPVVVLAIFVEKPTPFLEEFFQKIYNLDYSKKKLHLFLHNSAEYHETIVNEFLSNYTSLFASVKTILPKDNIKEWHARNLAIEYCLQKDCDYYFNADSEAHLDNPFTLKLLLEQNRGIVAPLLVRPYKAWSNFWGALSSEGFYARSHDYMEIVKGERRGLWNFPFIGGAYLINGTLIKNEETKPNYINNLLDADMAFAVNNRDRDIFMYISNRVDWGHLINADNFDTSHLHNEMYQIFDNRWDWELRYLHPNWSKSLEPNYTLLQPCPDVYWFPVATPRYCREHVAEVENFGKWSDGSNYDDRLEGGYENVPTVDIHMNQIGYEAHWLEFLRLYVEPLQTKVYVGYYHYAKGRPETGYDTAPTVDVHMWQIGYQDHWLEFLRLYIGPLNQVAYEGYEEPPQATMNFMVRYKPDEQRELKPHHDTSTYTINVAMNERDEYEGGGCRFTRYNCSVVDTKMGWLIMHPGKLTHQHEGLRIHKGTRYIMVSFIDP